MFIGPDQDELHPTHRRFISPRPSASGTKLYIHDNSLKCRANQQQQQRILSSFSSTAAMASSISNDNNRDSNDINSNNCSTNDGTHQINQTPSILAASTLPRNFSNKGIFVYKLFKVDSNKFIASKISDWYYCLDFNFYSR